MNDNQSYYGDGSGNQDNKTIIDRLRDRYDPDEFVVVKNIDNDPVVYQFVKPSAVETYSPNPGEKMTVQHEPPRRLTIQPGESKLCPAYEADKIAECTIKQIINKKTHLKIKQGEFGATQASDWSDPKTVEDMLDEIIVGKEDIVNSYNLTKPTVKEDVNKDLGLDDEPKQRPGRPRKED